MLKSARVRSTIQRLAKQRGVAGSVVKAEAEVRETTRKVDVLLCRLVSQPHHLNAMCADEPARNHAQAIVRTMGHELGINAIRAMGYVAATIPVFQN